MSKVLKFVRPVNGVPVEQRCSDGFINGTAMCVAHSKQVSDWLTTEPAWGLLVALSRRLGFQVKEGWNRNSNASRIAASFPHLLAVRRGSPVNGGGTWIHPKLAVHLAQWCSPEFALLVSDWVEEWMTTGRNPLQVDVEAEWAAWQQRYDIRINLKDSLRPELMNAVVKWAVEHQQSPRSLCRRVHDAMNECIQGAKSREIKALGGLPIGSLIRDYFEAAPLVEYSAINKLAKNAIEDRGIEPVQAVREACELYLGKSYTPKLIPIAENVYSQGRRLKTIRRQRRLTQDVQMDLFQLFGDNQAS